MLSRIFPSIFLFLFFQSYTQTDNKFSIKNILIENDYDLNSFYIGATLNHSQLNIINALGNKKIKLKKKI